MALKEIYCKLTSDVNYEPKLETDDEVQMILQQIRMVLGTKPGQVLGSPNFGIDLNKYLFSYNSSPEDIRYNVNAAIGYYIKFDPKRYTVGCEVSFGHEPESAGGGEYCVIDVYINSVKSLGVLVTESN